jgi:hypothetical protein
LDSVGPQFRLKVVFLVGFSSLEFPEGLESESKVA